MEAAECLSWAPSEELPKFDEQFCSDDRSRGHEKRHHQIIDHGASVSRLALKGSKRQRLTTPTIGRSTEPRQSRRHHTAAPRIGRLAMCAAGRYKVGEALLGIHAIPPDPINDVELTRTQIPQPSFYLVRPDGHVGLCGGRLEAAALRCYVAECLRLGVEVRGV